MVDPVSLAVTVALTAAQMAMTASRKIEGPRLDDLKVTVADYGTPLNYFYGIRRFDAVPIFFAEDIREEKHRRKTKGGKYNDYTYFGTWACAVADVPIEGVTRIWFDKHLIYDATGAGPLTPFSFGSGVSVADKIRFYLGTEDQEPDPRMLATVEAKEGAGSCPAYRGVAYIIFEDIPLEKVGNRIPQISVEAVTAANPHYPYEITTPTIDPPNDLDAFHFAWSPDRSRFMWSAGADFEIWDTAARASMVQSSWDDLGYTASIGMAVANNGVVYGIASTNPATTTYLVGYNPDGIGPGTVIAELFDIDNAFAATDLVICQSQADGTEIVCVKPFSIYRGLAYYTLGTIGALYLDTGPLAWQPTSFFADLDGNVWAVGCYQSDDILVFKRIYGAYGSLPAYFEVAGMPTTQGIVGNVQAFHYRDAAVDHFIVGWNQNRLIAIDLATQAVAITVTPTVIWNDTYIESVVPGASSFWVDGSEFSSVDLTEIRTIDDGDLASLWVSGSSISGTFFDPINNALVSTAVADGTLTWRYLDRIGSDGVLLSDIVEDVSTRCGIDPGDVNASDLDQIVPGYSWSRGAGKDILEPLIDAYDSIARPHDFGIQYLKLGDSSGGTIETAQFVRKGEEARYKITLAQDTDLPRRITFSFADKDKDQQNNSVVVQRPLDSVDGVRETSVDMSTLALDVDEARQLAERWFRRRWFGRETIENGLTMQYLALEPGDVRTLDRDGNAATFRLTKATFAADGVIACRWERDDPSIALLSGEDGATMDGRADAVILVPVYSKGFVLDIPLIRDADNDTNPILYYGAAPYSSTGTWPGAVFYQSADGVDYDIEWATVPSTSGLTWGYTTDVLADANPNLWDRGNSVNVVVKNGALTSTTEAACNISPTLNLCLLGDEMIQFTTATLEMDGSYTLSDLKRGRRGTEWATATHATGDQFVMLDAVGDVEMGASDVGDALYFKAPSVGRDVTSAFPIGLAYSGASLKPYAPCQIEAVKDDATGDWNFTWVRRSRIGGAWTGGTSVPLGEATEAYEIDILDGMGAVVRTLTSSTPTVVYEEADQITDGGDVAVGDLDVALYQISDVVDRGFAAEASF